MARVIGNGTSVYSMVCADKGIESMGGFVDVELADMIRAAASKQGVKPLAWMKRVWAEAVNAEGLEQVTYAPDGEIDDVQAWTYDMAKLAPKLTKAQLAEKARKDAEAAAAKAIAQAAADRAELEELRALKATMLAHTEATKVIAQAKAGRAA